jgi:hypothetical protein
MYQNNSTPNNRIITVDPSTNFMYQKLLSIIEWIYNLTGVNI